MAKKVIFADNILRAKGIEKAKFDTSKLNELVEKFFLDHDAKEKILLRSQRFIEMENTPEGDIIDMLDVSVWQKRCEDPDDTFTFQSYLTLLRNGLIIPTLIINEPFIGNAAGYLRDICGFTVTSRMRNRKKQYIVTLPI